jgi:hypothetical protein
MVPLDDFCLFSYQIISTIGRPATFMNRRIMLATLPNNASVIAGALQFH